MAGLGFWLQERDVFANYEHVCALSDMGAKREGTKSTRAASIFHFEVGRQQERWFYPEDPDARDRIFS